MLMLREQKLEVTYLLIRSSVFILSPLLKEKVAVQNYIYHVM